MRWRNLALASGLALTLLAVAWIHRYIPLQANEGSTSLLYDTWTGSVLLINGEWQETTRHRSWFSLPGSAVFPPPAFEPAPVTAAPPSFHEPAPYVSPRRH